MSRYLIGVDVGGTFTDVFFLDQETGAVFTAKAPSTRGDQSIGFIEGIGRGVNDASQIGTVIHGTTVGTNALLDRLGEIRLGDTNDFAYEDSYLLRGLRRLHLEFTPQD